MSIKEEILRHYSGNPRVITKTGEEHQVRIGENAVFVKLPSGDQPIMFGTLEKAVALIESGVRIRGPTDFREKVADQRPAYAWAILRDLGYVSEED